MAEKAAKAATQRAAAPIRSPNGSAAEHLRPDFATPGSELLRLQSMVGNQSTLGLLSSGVIQPKLQFDKEAQVSEGKFVGAALSSPQPALGRVSETLNGLPQSLRFGLEALSGMDLSGIRVHYNSATPAQFQALAFTHGRDIHIGPNQEKYLAHEGWHAIQQMQGRVRPTVHVRGVGINNDDRLEREADRMGAAAFRESFVANYGGKQVRKRNSIGELAPIARPQAFQGSPASIQRAPDNDNLIEYTIKVPPDVKTEKELDRYAEVMIFGKVRNMRWPEKGWNVKELASRGGTVRYRVHPTNVPASNGKPKGEIVRPQPSNPAYSQTEGETRSGIDAEINKRYWTGTGIPSGETIKKGESSKIEMWRHYRDEVITEQEQLHGLPAEIRQLLGGEQRWKPSDYAQLKRIAGKLTLTEWADYKARVTSTTADLDTLEASVNSYLAQKQARDEDIRARQEVQRKLEGTEGLYAAYKDYQKKKKAPGERQLKVGGRAYVPASKDELQAIAEAEKKLNASLVANDFNGGIPEFEAALDEFVRSFEKEAVHIGVGMLDYYESVLYREGERYKEDAVISALYDKLGGFRREYQQLAGQQQIMEEAAKQDRQREQSRMPGQGHVRPDESRRLDAGAALEKAKAHKAAAVKEVQNISVEHPLFSEENLSPERRIPKEKLARASKDEIKTILSTHIAGRKEDVRKTKQNLKDDPEIIFKMGNLMKAAYRQMEIEPGSLFDELIQERKAKIERAEMIVSFLLGVLAIAFTVASGGTGAFAVIGALGALGTSSYLAYEEFEKFRIATAAAGSGLSSQEPSPVWLVIAIAGAVLDAAAAAKAVSALAKSAKALETTKDLAPFRKAVKEQFDAGLIDAKVARSVEAAGEASVKYTAATEELTKALLGKLHSFPGPLVDPDVYRAVVKMAYYKAVQGVESFRQFLLELNRLRASAKLGELQGEELALAKKAFAEGTEAAKGGKLRVNLLTGERLVPGTSEHMAQRWFEYQMRNPNAFPKIADAIDPRWKKAYETILENAQKGGEFEQSVISALGATKNRAMMMGPPEQGLKGFIPDAIQGNPTELIWGQAYHFTEVKGWKDMSKTGNLAAMLDYVDKFGGSVTVVFRSAKHPSGLTSLSGPLQKRLDDLAKIDRAIVKRHP